MREDVVLSKGQTRPRLFSNNTSHLGEGACGSRLETSGHCDTGSHLDKQSRGSERDLLAEVFKGQ